MIIGNKVYHEKKCFNSLAWAKSEINRVEDGAIFLADVHEYTRGRSGRIWKFDPNQLIITLVLKPANLNEIFKTSSECLGSRINQLSMAISLGVLSALKKFNTKLKWPNDFLVDGKKIGGILGEVIWNGNSIDGIIYGFALNVNNIIEPDDDLFKKATTLYQVFGKKIDIQILYQEIIQSMDCYYQRWLNSEFDQIFSEWKHNQFYLGKNVTVHNKDGSLQKGLFSDLLPNGDLVLETTKEKKIISFSLVEDLE